VFVRLLSAFFLLIFEPVRVKHGQSAFDPILRFFGFYAAHYLPNVFMVTMPFAVEYKGVNFIVDFCKCVHFC